RRGMDQMRWTGGHIELSTDYMLAWERSGGYIFMWNRNTSGIGRVISRHKFFVVPEQQDYDELLPKPSPSDFRLIVPIQTSLHIFHLSSLMKLKKEVTHSMSGVSDRMAERKRKRCDVLDRSARRAVFDDISNFDPHYMSPL